MQKKEIIEKMIRCRGIRKEDVIQSLGITRPTFGKLLQDVNSLNGHQRIKLAVVLGVDVSVIDCIINNTDKNVSELTQAVLNIIKPIQDGNR
jgi:hypothetical protein